jgi:hypothetical protein
LVSFEVQHAFRQLFSLIISKNIKDASMNFLFSFLIQEIIGHLGSSNGKKLEEQLGRHLRSWFDLLSSKSSVCGVPDIHASIILRINLNLHQSSETLIVKGQ